jgi:hypothetical protein
MTSESRLKCVRNLDMFVLEDIGNLGMIDIMTLLMGICAVI